MENSRLIPLNFKKINDKYLIVNLAGDFAFLSDSDFKGLINSSIIFLDLENRFYFKDPDALSDVISKYKVSKQYLNQSTSLFILVVTNRCNLNCIYCQASKNNSSDKKYDMNKSTAKQAVDLILQFPGSSATIEFQGGEPLLNFEIIKFIVDYIKSCKSDKHINFSLVSNLIEMDDEKLNFVIENNISLCTSCDGNKEVQDYNRPYSRGSSLDTLKKQIGFIKDKGDSVGINGILTTTKKTLNFPHEVIDEYVDLGLNSIYIRSINPFGLAKNNLSTIGYSPEDFLDFYRKCLDYIIEINKGGKLFIEGTAQIFLKKILGVQGANHMEYRSPCGAAIGQMAINYDGDIYTCDEGRMMAQSGDNSFKIGDLQNSSYYNLFDNEVTKTMCMASCMEGFPRCHQCLYLPYCGICPIINYAEDGDIFKNNPFRCYIQEGILDYLFYLIDKNNDVVEIFKKWIS
jgi:uncharacterized protein